MAGQGQDVQSSFSLPTAYFPFHLNRNIDIGSLLSQHRAITADIDIGSYAQSQNAKEEAKNYISCLKAYLSAENALNLPILLKTALSLIGSLARSGRWCVSWAQIPIVFRIIKNPKACIGKRLKKSEAKSHP